MWKSLCSAAAFAVFGLATVLLAVAPRNLALVQPVTVTPCDLLQHARIYDGTQVRVVALVYNGFEDATLHHPACTDEYPNVWYEFSGALAPADHNYSEFRELLDGRADGPMIPAVLSGRFQSGAGGHMGCCPVLTIERIEEFSTAVDPLLDYARPWDIPSPAGVGGWAQILEVPARPEAERLQRNANKGQAGFSYDPWLVAANELVRHEPNAPGLDLNGIDLREVFRKNGRVGYEWTNATKKLVYRIVVSRPYWLRPLAGSSERVVWIPVEAYCSGRGNAKPSGDGPIVSLVGKIAQE